MSAIIAAARVITMLYEVEILRQTRIDLKPGPREIIAKVKQGSSPSDPVRSPAAVVIRDHHCVADNQKIVEIDWLRRRT